LYRDKSHRLNLRGDSYAFVAVASTGTPRFFPEELKYLLAEVHGCVSEGDYYYVDQGDDGFFAGCFLNTRDNLAAMFERARSQAEAALGPDAARFVGMWEGGGNPYVTFSEYGGLVFVNERGDTAPHAVVSGVSVYSPVWRIRGTLNASGDQLVWENGSIWKRPAR
jgi:hypothetical protein